MFNLLFQKTYTLELHCYIFSQYIEKFSYTVLHLHGRPKRCKKYVGNTRYIVSKCLLCLHLPTCNTIFSLFQLYAINLFDLLNV